MTLVKEITSGCGGASKTFEGPNGRAILTKNLGNRDNRDRWSLLVDANGKVEKLATRMEYNKAYALAESIIG